MMMPSSLSDMTPSAASLLSPQETDATATPEAPLLPFAAVLSGTLALLPPSPKSDETGDAVSETEQLLHVEHPVESKPSDQESGPPSPLQNPAWPEPAALTAITMSATPDAPAVVTPSEAAATPTASLQTPTNPATASSSAPAPAGLSNVPQTAPPLPPAPILPSTEEAPTTTTQPEPRAPVSSHLPDTTVPLAETQPQSRDVSQEITQADSSDLQPAKHSTDPRTANRAFPPDQPIPAHAPGTEDASLHEAAPEGAKKVTQNPDLPDVEGASQLKVGAAETPDTAPSSKTSQQAPKTTEAAAPAVSHSLQDEPAQTSKTSDPSEVPSKTTPSETAEAAEAARPVQGKATQENTQKETTTQTTTQPQATTGKEHTGQEMGQHAGNHRGNQDSPASASDTPAKTTPEEAIDPDQRQPVAGPSQERPAQANASAHRDRQPEPDAPVQTRQPVARPSEPAAAPDAPPLPETAALPETEARLSGMEDALRTAAETQTDTTAPERKTASSASSLLGREPVRPAWLRAVQSRPLRTYAEAGWNVLEMQLEEGEGTVTIKARREEERVAVSVGFSDPTLRALASAQSDRLQQVLQTQYDSAVDFSLMNSGSDTPGRREDSPEAHGPANPNGSNKAPETHDNPLPARGPMPGARNEWVG